MLQEKNEYFKQKLLACGEDPTADFTNCTNQTQNNTNNTSNVQGLNTSATGERGETGGETGDIDMTDSNRNVMTATFGPGGMKAQPDSPQAMGQKVAGKAGNCGNDAQILQNGLRHAENGFEPSPNMETGMSQGISIDTELRSDLGKPVMALGTLNPLSTLNRSDFKKSTNLRYKGTLTDLDGIKSPETAAADIQAAETAAAAAAAKATANGANNDATVTHLIPHANNGANGLGEKKGGERAVSALRGEPKSKHPTHLRESLAFRRPENSVDLLETNKYKAARSGVETHQI